MSEHPTKSDRFLDGRLVLRQPVRGYRAGMDALVLAAATAALGVRTVADLGCGVGAVMLAAACLQSGARFTGIERDPVAAGLCAANVTANGLDGRAGVVLADGLALSAAQDRDLRERFDLVVSNPPFFDDARALRLPAPERRGAWIAGVPLAEWIGAMLRLAAPKGRVLLLHRADRLGDILAALGSRAGQITIYPLRPRAGEPAGRVLVCARRGSRAPLRLLGGLDLHPDAGGPDGGERFTAEAAAVLAGAAPPGWPA